MKSKRYYIKPGDDRISFDLPLLLSEIKHLHRLVAEEVEEDAIEGIEVLPTIELLKKFKGLIEYLQAEK